MNSNGKEYETNENLFSEEENIRRQKPTQGKKIRPVGIDFKI